MYNEFNNMNSVDLLGIVKNMDYKGFDIHYYTGICKDEIFMSIADVLDIISENKRTKLTDVDKVLIKAGIIPEYIKHTRPYFIESYINNQCVIYTSIIKLCEYYGEKELKSFIIEAAKMINNIGFYVEELKFNYNNRKRNKEPNVSDLLRRQDLRKFYDYSNMSYSYDFEDLYKEVVDRISYLVFNCSMSDLRYDRNIYFDDKVSDYISDREYNEVCIASKIFSYMLSCNHHLGLEYIEYLVYNVLEMKCNKNNNVSITTGEFEEEEETSPNPYINMFKRLDSLRYDDSDDVNDFIDHM